MHGAIMYAVGVETPASRAKPAPLPGCRCEPALSNWAALPPWRRFHRLLCIPSDTSQQLSGAWSSRLRHMRSAALRHSLPHPTTAFTQRAGSHSSRSAAGRQPLTRAMLLEHLPALEGRRIVLASASPRRRELLQQMGLKFEVGVWKRS